MSLSYTFARLPQGRKTVVALLRVLGAKAVPGHLLQDFDMTWANSLMAAHKEDGERITVTSLLLKAIGLAQKEHPLSRTEVIGAGKTVTYHDIVGGITVERDVDGQKTVFFAEVLSPHLKTLNEIAIELDDYSRVPIQKSPAMQLQISFSSFPWFMRSLILNIGKTFPALRLKCQKATFGLTTLGKYGISCVMSPCICTSTFAIAAMEEKVVVIAGEITVRKMMNVSFNFDQRAFDPASAAAFFYEVRALMEGGLQKYIDEERESELITYSM